eukprot:644666-Amphidinium_carterae.1
MFGYLHESLHLQNAYVLVGLVCRRLAFHMILTFTQVELYVDTAIKSPSMELCQAKTVARLGFMWLSSTYV